MEQFVGLDVSLAETSLCVVDSHVAAPFSYCGGWHQALQSMFQGSALVSRVGSLFSPRSA